MKKIVLWLVPLLLAACSSTPQANSGPTSSVGLGTPPATLQPGIVLRTAEPSTWKKFGLTGHLILIEFNPDGNRLFN